MVVRLRDVKIGSILILIFFIVNPLYANPFHHVDEKTTPGFYYCQHQQAKNIIKSLKPLKPSSCKISSTYSGNKIVYHCKDLAAQKTMGSLLQEIDSVCDPVRIKVYWLAIQAHKAKDLLKIFKGQDLNVKNLWKVLLTSYINQGMAKTLANPEIFCVVGSSFQFQTDEVFKQSGSLRGKKKTARHHYKSKVHLLLQGDISQLTNKDLLLNLQMQYKADFSQNSESPECGQKIATQILVKKGGIYPVGGIYQMKSAEKGKGNILTTLLPFTSDAIDTNADDQQFVSTVFIEIEDPS